MKRYILFFFVLAVHLGAVSITYTDVTSAGLARVKVGTVTFTGLGGTSGLRPGYRFSQSEGTNVASVQFQIHHVNDGVLAASPITFGASGTTDFVASYFDSPGDGFWFIRPATTYRPTPQKVFVSTYFDPNTPPDGSEGEEGEGGGAGGSWYLRFVATNNTGDTLFYGIQETDSGAVFNYGSVNPGGTYDQTIPLAPGDEGNYQLVTVNTQGFANDPDPSNNPAGVGYIHIYDGDSNGSYNDPYDYILPPSQYVTPVGPPKTLANATQGPKATGTATGSATTVTTPATPTSGGTSTAPITTVSPIAPASGGGAVTPGGTGYGTGNLTEGTASARLAEINASIKAQTSAIGSGFGSVNGSLAAIKGAIEAQGPNGGGGGSGGGFGVDVSGIETRLDTANTTLTAMDARFLALEEEGVDIRAKVDESAGVDVADGISQALADGEEAGEGVLNSPGVSAIVGVAQPGVSMAAGGSASVNVQLAGPILVGGFGSSTDLSPTSSSGAQSRLGQDWSWFLTWVRHFIAATSVMWFCKEAIDAARAACFALGATPQHQLGGSTAIVLHGNVMGNSVGMVPASAMWALSVIGITAALVAAPTLVAAGVYTFANVGGVISAAASSFGSLAEAAGSGAPGVFGTVFKLANAVCPIGLLIVIAGNRVLLSVASLVQFVALHVGLKLAGMI